MSNFVQLHDLPYEVNEFGVVRSLPRVVTRSNGRPHTVRAKEIRPVWNGGHWQVYLCVDGRKHVRYVHHLVLEAFDCLRPSGMKGLHRDDDPHNNHIDNLYWGTMQDNAFDRVRNGNDVNARKAACNRGHELTGLNLAPWGAKYNQRICLVCNRAKTLANYQGRAGDETYVQALSDEKYVALMGGMAVMPCE